MKITEIFIQSFGKLRGVKMSLGDGVNIIYGENEAGKSTVMAFILAMLYGAGKGDQRRLYEPWDGGKMAGILSFEHGGRDYQLKRQFGQMKSGDKTELWCMTSGEQLTYPERMEPGEYVLGMNRETFINTTYIGQAGVAIRGDNNEILAKLTNLAASGDETASRSEISGRLEDAMALLRSRRSGAILPGLEKQRLDRIEERAAISRRSSEADRLRDDVTRLTHRRDRLSDELENMEKRRKTMSDLHRLAQLEGLIAQKTELDDIEKKYTELHNAMFSEESGIDQDFLENVRAQLEEYRSIETEVRVRQDQLSECEEKLEAIDRTPLSRMRTIKKHSDRISAAFDEYYQVQDSMRRLERELEEKDNAKAENKDSLQNLMIIAAALCILFILLGIWKPVFFVLAALVALIGGAYFFIQKKGITFGGLPKENMEFINYQNDLRDINRGMRPVLDELGVASMDELDSALHLIDVTRNHISERERDRDSIIEELAALRERLSATLEKLKEKLSPYKEVKSDAQAVRIIAGLDKAQCEHAALEAQFKAAQEAFDAAIAGQDYDYVCLEAEELRANLGDEVKDGGAIEAEEAFEQTVQKCRDELVSTKEELARRETELSTMNTDPQEMNRLEEEIKLLDDRITRYEFELSALEIAQSALNEAFESMQKDFGPMINYRASRIVEALTGGKHTSVIVSESLTPSVADSEGSIHACSSLSLGTADQVYFALRLAIAGMIQDEKMPLMLDDAFAQFDDKRMSDAMYYLGTENGAGRMGQVVLFTCHDKSLHVAKELGMLEGVVQLKG